MNKKFEDDGFSFFSRQKKQHCPTVHLTHISQFKNVINWPIQKTSSTPKHPQLSVPHSVNCSKAQTCRFESPNKKMMPLPKWKGRNHKKMVKKKLREDLARTQDWVSGTYGQHHHSPPRQTLTLHTNFDSPGTAIVSDHEDGWLHWTWRCLQNVRMYHIE